MTKLSLPMPTADLAPFWQRFTLNHARQRLAHAMLLMGSLHTGLAEFAQRMAAAIFCKQPNGPCEQCQSCHLMAIGEHPDLTYLSPEKSGSVIKIEQVRSLHSIIYTSPQLRSNRVVIINPTERLNSAASNALLKILEEPPADCYFILIAEQMSTIPATIISRCQLWRLPSSMSLQHHYLMQGNYYSPESERAKIFSQLDGIIDQLLQLQNAEITINTLASKWVSFEFNELIWLLYLITAQMIQESLIDSNIVGSSLKKLNTLAKGSKPLSLFAQIDKLNEIINNLNHTLSINQLLVLEDLLLGYT